MIEKQTKTNKTKVNKLKNSKLKPKNTSLGRGISNFQSISTLSEWDRYLFIRAKLVENTEDEQKLRLEFGYNDTILKLNYRNKDSVLFWGEMMNKLQNSGLTKTKVASFDILYSVYNIFFKTERFTSYQSFDTAHRTALKI